MFPQKKTLSISATLRLVLFLVLSIVPDYITNLSGKEIMVGAIGISLGIYVVASIVPSALTNFFNVNTTGWDSDVVTLWDLIPVFAILAVAILFIVIAYQRMK